MKKINLFIDGLFYKSSGIGRYYEFLIKELPKRDEINNVYTTVNIYRKKEFIEETESLSKIKPIYVNYNFFSPREFLFKGKILRDVEDKVDIFHFPQINLPLYLPKNLIVTIHDLEPLERKNDFLKKKVFGFYLSRTIRKSKKIVAISKITEKRILKFYPFVQKKIKIIHRTVDGKFLDERGKFSRIVKEDYILYVGNRKKHKNLGNLIKAFRIVNERYPELKLVIAGSKFSEKDEVDILKKKLHLENEVIEFVSPSDEKLINLYAKAKLFILPSFYEGFGLTPLEAMALRIPVIVSNLPVLMEVYGGATLFIDPHSPQDIAEGVLKVFRDNELRRNLIQNGFKQVRNFNQEKIIQKHINLYREVLNENFSG